MHQNLQGNAFAFSFCYIHGILNTKYISYSYNVVFPSIHCTCIMDVTSSRVLNTVSSLSISPAMFFRFCHFGKISVQEDNIYCSVH